MGNEFLCNRSCKRCTFDDYASNINDVATSGLLFDIGHACRKCHSRVGSRNKEVGTPHRCVFANSVLPQSSKSNIDASNLQFVFTERRRQ